MLPIASTTPVGRFALPAALVLSLGAAQLATRPHHERVSYRLELSAPVEEHAIYLTRWYFGDVTVSFDDGKLEPVQFRQRAHVYDGCYWQGTETLVPITPTQFRYDYSEQLLSCEPDAVPLRKTPRSGIVTAVPIAPR